MTKFISMLLMRHARPIDIPPPRPIPPIPSINPFPPPDNPSIKPQIPIQAPPPKRSPMVPPPPARPPPQTPHKPPPLPPRSKDHPKKEANQQTIYTPPPLPSSEQTEETKSQTFHSSPKNYLMVTQKNYSSDQSKPQSNNTAAFQPYNEPTRQSKPMGNQNRPTKLSVNSIKQSKSCTDGMSPQKSTTKQGEYHTGLPEHGKSSIKSNEQPPITTKTSSDSSIIAASWAKKPSQNKQKSLYQLRKEYEEALKNHLSDTKKLSDPQK